MKKLLLILVILLASCNSKDNIIEPVLDNEIKHLDRYLYIQKHSTDTIILKYIDSLKLKFKKEAISTKGFLKGKEGIINGHFPKSLELVNEYIDKLE